ncbi:hypothetical protein [Mariprofundus sp. KV]|uniref:hypothetical protein n=1 Tax=Mariprofundus sp. KV TaxID=2608715 RepID=UPI0015A4A338|nr:hypothetical protein [Mariprofundus sp. KV]NWF35148.1 hypothetical protein [Mariprofundus sp. KV]
MRQIKSTRSGNCIRVILCSLALVLASMPVQAEGLATASTGTVIPEPNKGGMLGTSIKPDVEGDAKALKGDTKVAVPYFRIKFIKEFSESNSESALT